MFIYFHRHHASVHRPFTEIAQPSRLICILKRLILYMGFTLAYAPILLKSIYRIFESSRTQVSLPNVVSPKSQIMLTMLGSDTSQFLKYKHDERQQTVSVTSKLRRDILRKGFFHVLYKLCVSFIDNGTRNILRV